MIVFFVTVDLKLLHNMVCLSQSAKIFHISLTDVHFTAIAVLAANQV